MPSQSSGNIVLSLVKLQIPTITSYTQNECLTELENFEKITNISPLKLCNHKNNTPMFTSCIFTIKKI